MRYAIIVLLLLISVPARADWQNTKWGMTEQQVKAVVNGATPATDQDIRNAGKTDILPRLRAPYRAGAYDFLAIFAFDSRGGLRDVQLKLNNLERCNELLSDMRSRYGKTEYEDVTLAGTFLRWIQQRETVRATRIGPLGGAATICGVDYSSRETANNKGL